MLDHHRAVLTAQAAQRQQRYVCSAEPCRHKFRSKCDQAQHWQFGKAIDDQVKQLAERWIDPVRILYNHQDWGRRRERRQFINQRRQGPLLALLRRQMLGRSNRGTAHRQEVREQCNRLVAGETIDRHQPLQLFQLLRGAIMMIKAGRAAQLSNDRV